MGELFKNLIDKLLWMFVKLAAQVKRRRLIFFTQKFSRTYCTLGEF